MSAHDLVQLGCLQRDRLTTECSSQVQRKTRGSSQPVFALTSSLEQWSGLLEAVGRRFPYTALLAGNNLLLEENSPRQTLKTLPQPVVAGPQESDCVMARFKSPVE